MDRERLDFIIASNEFLPNGTKSCVSEEEFKVAVKVLIAYAFLKEDNVPKFWHCDLDCQRYSWILCKGEFNIDKEAKDVCPHFIDSGFK